MEIDLPMLVNIYYYVFAALAVPINLLLVYLILFKSPPSFMMYRYLLLNTSISEFFLILLSFLLQIRIISAGDSIALLPYGPLRFLDREISFIVYNVYNVFLVSTYLSLFIAMHYRYSLICTGRCETLTIIRNCSIVWILPAAMLIGIIVPPYDFDTVVMNTEKSYPNYQLTVEYGKYGGFRSTSTIIYLINTAILMGIPYMMPAFILFWRFRIFKQINEVQTHLSERTKKASLDLVRALTMQAMFPMVCLIPNVAYFVTSQIRHMEYPLAEYITFPTCVLPCLIDPILTIYYVAPFRNFITRRQKRPLGVIPTISIAPSSTKTMG